jgi:hypothetical protein
LLGQRTPIAKATIATTTNRMREICLSGSMSGNRKQSQAKPDCGGEAKALAERSHREAKALAPVLDSTRDYAHYFDRHAWQILRPYTVLVPRSLSNPHGTSLAFSSKPLGCWGCRRMGAKSGGEKLRKSEWPARILCSTGNSPLPFLSTHTFAVYSERPVSRTSAGRG